MFCRPRSLFRVVGYAIGMTVLAATLGVSCSSPSSNTVALKPVVVTPDTTAARLIEVLWGRRLLMDDLLDKERRWDDAMDAALNAGRTPTRWVESESYKRSYDRLDGLADSCSSILSSHVTGLTWVNGVAWFSWREVEPKRLFNIMVHYGYRGRSKDGVRANTGDLANDICDVAAQVAPVYFRAYQRVNYIEIVAHNTSGGVLGRLGVTRRGSEIVGDSVARYNRAARQGIPGLGLDASVGKLAFEFKPNRFFLE